MTLVPKWTICVCSLLSLSDNMLATNSPLVKHRRMQDVSEPSETPVEQTVTDPPQGSFETPVPVIAPSSAPISKPNYEENSDDETSNVVISGWWTGCTESRDAPSDPCSGADLISPDGGAIIIDFESCYSNPNFESRGVSFYWVDSSNDEIFGFHLLLASDEAYSIFAPTECDSGVCDCSTSQELADLRQVLLNAGSCSAMINDEIKCLKQQVTGKSEACYVPMLEDFSNETETKMFCAMAAEIKHLMTEVDSGDFSLPGEAEEPEDRERSPGVSDSKYSSTTAMTVGLVCVLVVCGILWIVVIRARTQRSERAKEFGFKDEDPDEVVWIPTAALNPKFSTRGSGSSVGSHSSVRGDGLFSTSHSTPMWTSTVSRSPETPIVGPVNPTRSSPRYGKHITDLRFTIS